MNRIKNFFKLIVVMILGTSVLVFFSLRGEENYLENCKTLSLDCEKGRIQDSYEKFKSWVADSFQEVLESSPAINDDSIVSPHESTQDKIDMTN